MIKKAKKRKRIYRIAWMCMAIFGVGIITAIALLLINNADYFHGNQSYQELRSEAQEVISNVDGEENATQTSNQVQIVETQEVTKPAEYHSPIDFKELTTINPDVKAWLLSAGTVIDYPVARGEDNEYYLSHLFNREKNKLGCLFIDYRNAGDFTDKNTVVYGHHMRSGAMFAGLTSYRDQSYYDLFPTMTIYTPERQGTIEFFAGVIENGNKEFVRFQFDDESDFLSYVDSLKANSVFRSDVEVKPDDLLVTLCTCSYEFDNARFELVGRLIWQ